MFKVAQAEVDKETGRGPASVQQIEKGGHMVRGSVGAISGSLQVLMFLYVQFVQTVPEATANAIYNTISWRKVGVRPSFPVRSRSYSLVRLPTSGSLTRRPHACESQPRTSWYFCQGSAVWLLSMGLKGFRSP